VGYNLRIKNRRKTTNQLSGGKKTYEAKKPQQIYHPDKMIQPTPKILKFDNDNVQKPQIIDPVQKNISL
jgi:hypothetical protein